MGKYIIHPSRKQIITGKRYTFRLQRSYGDSATLLLSTDGNYSISVSGYDNDSIIESRAKRDPQYKLGMQQISQELYNDYIRQTEEITKMHKRAFALINQRSLERERDKIKMEYYSRKDFVVPKPTMEEVKKISLHEAKRLYHNSSNFQQETSKFVEDNSSKTFEERVAYWNEIQDLYSKIEGAHENKMNAKFKSEYNKKRKVFDDKIEGDTDIVSKGFRDAEDVLSIPYPIELDYKYDKDKRSIDVSIEIPSNIDSLIPTKKASVLSTGKISIKDKLQREINSEVTESKLSLVYYIASYVFSITSNIENCYITVWNRDRTKGICWFNFSRNKFESTTNPFEYTLAFPHVCRISEYRGATVLDSIPANEFKSLIQDIRER